MSIRIAFIRHGPTEWNAEKRLQGRSDIPLSEAGRAKVATWHLPRLLSVFSARTSPLCRAQETAKILLGRVPPLDSDLIEMDFGQWEGERLPVLRETLGAEMTRNEARGLDFTPPGGESPRVVQTRLQGMFHRWLDEKEDRLAFAHKGVIRAAYAMAVGWDMTGRPPHKLDWNAAHLFQFDARAGLSVQSLNLLLTDENAGP